jgi:alginate O-acetyltransferase complex protein AlgI
MQGYTLQAIVILILIYFIYWIKPFSRVKIQNLLLLIASYSCYAFLDWRFLILVICITLVNLIVGKVISTSENSHKRKLFLILNIILHIGLLGFFRYYNFFVASVIKCFSFFSADSSWNSLNIIVPLGISIYTLQALSYSIDIYRRKIEPTKDIVAFFAYVSFFPQMIAGPIERASTFLPQFYKERQYNIDDIKKGSKRILWGLFKKLVIANNLAVYANEIFRNYSDYSGFTIFAGLVSFAFQLYTDLSGYSDIAIGIARLFGFTINTNFRIPYFSKNFNDFWSRWNISLMYWIKDYVYNPLGGSEGKPWVVFRNLFILFFLFGLWHGGNISFVLFGLVNALILLPSALKPESENNNYFRRNKILNNIESFIRFLITGFIVVVGLTFFRSGSSADAVNILRNLFTNVFSISINELRSLGNGLNATISNVVILFIYVIIEEIQRKSEFALDFNNARISTNNGRIITILVLILLLFFYEANQELIYFNY